MDRPTKEIKLTKSGYTVKLVTFFMHGEKKQITAYAEEGTVVEYIDGKTHITNMPTDTKDRREDAQLLAGIKGISDKEGKALEVTKETIDSLPQADIEEMLTVLNSRDDIPDPKK